MNARNFARHIAWLAGAGVAVLVVTGVPAIAQADEPLEPGDPPAGGFLLGPSEGNSAGTFAGSLVGADQVCPGDTNTGFSWNTFIATPDVDIAAITWGLAVPGFPDFGAWQSGQWAPVFTDQAGSSIVGQAPGLEDGFVSPPGDIEFSNTQRYGNLPDGEYQIGIACTKVDGGVFRTFKYWVGEMTVTANGGDGANDFDIVVSAATPASTTTTTTEPGATGTTTTTVSGGSGTTTTTTVSGGSGTTTTTVADGSTTTTVAGASGTTTTTTTNTGGGGTTFTTVPFGSGGSATNTGGSGGGTLANTGSSSTVLFLAALGLLVVGRMVILTGRRIRILPPGSR